MSTTTTSITSLLTRVQQRLPDIKMPALLTTILSLLFSWRTLFFLLAITNLKSLPLSWHVRLFFNMTRAGKSPDQIRKRLLSAAATLPPPSNITPANPKPLHPIFRPLALHTRAPLGECDYNLHKSNSTYFSDLDLSRGNLVASLINPALRFNALVPHGIRKGLCYPILGSVHTSFLREIKPYEAYDVRSRILGWDRKWLIIGSWFVRRATKEEIQKDKASGKDFLKGPVGEEEVVFACVLNKYVIKAGRVTVPPELCLAGSGWFPVRPEATATIRAYKTGGASATGTGTVTPALGPNQTVDNAANAVQNVAMEAGRRLSMSAEKKGRLFDEEHKKDKTSDDWPGWTWDEIEAERQRGLKIAERWLNMDVELRKEYEEDMARQIF